jgi:hypothetical protein
MERYSAPFLHASYDVQSRIYNIVINDFLKNLSSPDPDTINYSLQNTEYLIAQYFGWCEMIRCETQFIELGSRKKTIQLSKSLDDLAVLSSANRYRVTRLGQLVQNPHAPLLVGPRTKRNKI